MTGGVRQCKVKVNPCLQNFRCTKMILNTRGYFLFYQDISHVVMEQATGKQGKDDNNIGSIISMLITDQV